MNPIAIRFFIIGIGIASISKELNPGYGFTSGYWPALLGLIVASGYWIYDHALRHFQKISKGIWPSHWGATALRFGLATLFIVPVNIYAWEWIRVIDTYVFGMCFFGIVFDFSLNNFRDKHPLHVGINDSKDSITDKIFTKFGRFGGLLLLILRVVGMGITALIVW